MKSLRVLAGLHAGGQVSLRIGQWQVCGADGGDRPGGFDIVLDDFCGEPLWLDVPDGSTTVRRRTGPSSEWEDWPVHQSWRRGNVVLCLLDDAVTSPSDLELLTQALGPQSSAGGTTSSKPARGMIAVAAGALGAALVPLAALLVTTSGQANTEAVGADASLRQLLRDAPYRQLQLQEDGEKLVVSGLLSTSSDEARLRTALGHLAPGRVLAAWDVVPRLVDTLHTAVVSMPGQRGLDVGVRYVGDGVFAVAGHAPDPDALRRAAPRLQADLGSNVRGLLFELERSPSKFTYSAVVRAGELSYAQRRDGTKVFDDNDGATR